MIEPSATARRRDGGSVVVEWMHRQGIARFFHVPGETFLPILDALSEQDSVGVVTCRHESGASFAAEGFAKITGIPAVCMATRAPGACNLAIGVHTAFYDSTPLIAMVGLVPTRLAGSQAFQEFDVAALFTPIAKRVLQVQRVDALADTLDQAYAIATSGRPGPVVIGLPGDVLAAAAPDDGGALHRGSAPQADRDLVRWDASGVAGMLREASNPALLVATGAVRDGTAAAVMRFAELTGLPMFTGWRRLSAVDTSHPNYAGTTTLGERDDAREAIRRCDLLVGIGFAIDQIAADVGGLDREGLTIVQLAPAADRDYARQAARARVVEIAVPVDAAAESLMRWAEEHPSEAAALRSALPPRPASTVPHQPQQRPGRVHPDVLLAALDAVLPANAVVTSDVGNFAQWMVRHLRFDRDRVFVGALSGAMGCGIPYAIGAQLAAPSRPAWSVGGDGGVLMTAAEMATAARNQLDIGVLVVDNGVYGTIRAKQNALFPERLHGTELGGVDFAALARSFGWEAWTVERDAEVAAALEAAAATSGCRLVHALVEERPWVAS